MGKNRLISRLSFVLCASKLQLQALLFATVIELIVIFIRKLFQSVAFTSNCLVVTCV